MNLVSTDPTAPPPPPLPPRSSFGCDRHPLEQFTGFCPSCLCERLTSLDNSSSNTPSTSRRPSSASAAAAAAIRSLVPTNSKGNCVSHLPPLRKAPKPSTFDSELRRAKSFSASKNESLGFVCEPQRKSCDVRVRNTLWSLFTLDDENRCGTIATQSRRICQNIRNVEGFRDSVTVEGVSLQLDDDSGGGGDEIRPVAETPFNNLSSSVGFVEQVSTLKPLREHIDLFNIPEKTNSGAGIWAAASVFSKRWRKWRQKQKQKTKKQNKLTTLPMEKPISRQHRETQSEIADYGFGRRSCDTDPRFSLDAGRISVDDPRYSFEEPRASWDGYFTGRSFNRMAPMLSVLEDAPMRSNIARRDMLIPVEESATGFENVAESVPGGTAQTREYYSDSSSRRRKSLDRSSSMRKASAAMVAEIDELKPVVSNTKVSPTSADYFHGAKVMIGEKVSRDLRSNSLRDTRLETFELARDSSSSISRSGEEKDLKKSRGWRWRLWGFIQGRSNLNKDEYDDQKFSRANTLERSYSASWHDPRIARTDSSRKLNRSTSVRWGNGNGSFRQSMEVSSMSNNHGSKRRQESMLEKNRSARYLSENENGLLRFYFTPMTSSRSRGFEKVKANNSQSIAKSVLRLY